MCFFGGWPEHCECTSLTLPGLDPGIHAVVQRGGFAVMPSGSFATSVVRGHVDARVKPGQGVELGFVNSHYSGSGLGSHEPGC